MAKRDVVVIGASMGGVEALSQLAGMLPADLAAAVLVVQHTAESSPGMLAQILDGRGGPPAVMAEDGMAIEPGRIHVAPPGRHLIVREDGKIGVVFGPRENLSRPAIDALFRTAAVHFRSRAIGVVLTGLLGDGAAGLVAIRACGGVPIVQSLDDAAYPEMPTRALDAVQDARTAPLSEIPEMITRLTAEDAPPAPPVPQHLAMEARLTERGMEHQDWYVVPSHPTDFTCPDCSGALREVEGEDSIHRYRCRVGHGFTLSDLDRGKSEKVEEAVWLAMQTLHERAQVFRKMAAEERNRGRKSSAKSYDDSYQESCEYASRLKALLVEMRP